MGSQGLQLGAAGLQGSRAMKLMEEEKKESKVIQNGTNGTNGNGVHTTIEDPSDSESDMEDVEPVSATLVLRVVSEPPSPALSRKSSFRKDQPPAFLNHDSRGDNFLQVQVQRSTSSSSSSSMYGLSELDLHRPNGVNSVDFMHQVSE